MVFGQCYKANFYTTLLQRAMRRSMSHQIILQEKRSDIMSCHHFNLQNSRHFVIERACATRFGCGRACSEVPFLPSMLDT